MSVIEQFSQQLGMSLYLFLLIMIWTLTWKLIALWKAARNKHITWFIVLALVNTIGILPILYLFLFQDFSKKEDKIEPIKKPKRKIPIKKSPVKKKPIKKKLIKK
jgi:membrane protein YdbS with pleckstrin-like domain